MRTSGGLAAAIFLASLIAGSASASDESDVKAFITRWVSDFNRDDIKAFTGGCTPQSPTIDGFPPYAWPSCEAWMAAYATNSRRIQLVNGRLSIGDAVYADIARDHAYLVYPAVFTDQENGVPVTYRGTWTMTLKKARGAWRITGTASNWGGDYTVHNSP